MSGTAGLAASRQLHISQAALTKSLRQLEEDAGVPLLVRSPRGVSLTEAGQRLFARTRLVTRQLDLVAVELPALDPGELQLRLLTRPDAPLTPATAYFAQCLVDACSAPPSAP